MLLSHLINWLNIRYGSGCQSGGSRIGVGPRTSCYQSVK